jgi:hypothetical protein
MQQAEIPANAFQLRMSSETTELAPAPAIHCKKF